MTDSISSISEIKAMLQSFITTGWLSTDSHNLIPQNYRGEALAVVTREDVLRILHRFLTGEWDAQGIGSWSGALFASYRRYITYEAGYGTVIDDVLAELASFWSDITQEEVQQLYDQLKNAQYDPTDTTV